MKIRNGFVSNSSSSSFILATTVENLDSVVATLDEEQSKMFKKLKSQLLGKSAPIKAFGKELHIFEIYDMHGESPFNEMEYESDDDNYDYPDENPYYKLWYDVIEPALLKNKEESLSYTVDM